MLQLSARKLVIRGSILTVVGLLLFAIGRPAFRATRDVLLARLRPAASPAVYRVTSPVSPDAKTPPALPAGAPGNAAVAGAGGVTSQPGKAKQPKGKDPATTSKYYSIGKVKPFSGDVNLPGVLTAAAKARSFGGEIILITSNANAHEELYARWAVAAIVSMRNAGFEHYLLVMSTPEGCVGVKAIYPPAECCWTTWHKDHPNAVQWQQPHGSLFWLWAMRWKVAAELLGEGLNVMSSDLDVAFVRDPYEALKTPPLSEYNLIMRQEPLGQLPLYDGSVNCGWAYAQNAAVDGATRWVLAETVARIENWMKDPRGGKHDRGFHALYEQAIFTDVLRSAFAGRSMFREDIRYTAGKEEHAWNKIGYLGAVVPGAVLWRVGREPVPSPHPPCDGCSSLPPGFSPQPLFWHELHIAPDAKEPWDRPGGPAGLPAANWTQGADDEPWVPRLPAVQAAAGAALERVVAAPAWLQTTWVESRELGYTGLSPPQFYLHHNVLTPSPAAKRMSSREWGFWPPEADASPPGVPSTLVVAGPGTKVVAMGAGYKLRCETFAATLESLKSLLSVAAAADRKLAIPPLDCNSPWIPRSSDVTWAYSSPKGTPGPAEGRVLVSGPVSSPRCALLPDYTCEEAQVMHPRDLEMFRLGMGPAPVLAAGEVAEAAQAGTLAALFAPHAASPIVYLDPKWVPGAIAAEAAPAGGAVAAGGGGAASAAASAARSRFAALTERCHFDGSFRIA